MALRQALQARELVGIGQFCNVIFGLRGIFDARVHGAKIYIFSSLDLGQFKIRTSNNVQSQLNKGIGNAHYQEANRNYYIFIQQMRITHFTESLKASVLM